MVGVCVGRMWVVCLLQECSFLLGEWCRLCIFSRCLKWCSWWLCRLLWFCQGLSRNSVSRLIDNIVVVLSNRFSWVGLSLLNQCCRKVFCCLFWQVRIQCCQLQFRLFQVRCMLLSQGRLWQCNGDSGVLVRYLLFLVRVCFSFCLICLGVIWQVGLMFSQFCFGCQYLIQVWVLN